MANMQGGVATCLLFVFHCIPLFAMFVSVHAGKTEGAANSIPRIYTVLPPPPDYNLHSENSVIPPQLESMNRTEDPPGRTILIFIFIDQHYTQFI